MSTPVNPDDAPLPKGWTREYSNKQKRYFYFHKDTKHVQWHFPTASEAKDPTKAKERARQNLEREEKKRSSSDRGADSSSADGSGKKRHRPDSSSGSKKEEEEKEDDDFLALADSTSVAIIVPYRDLHAAQHRAAHLKKFVPHMVQFLQKLKESGQVSDYHVYIIEQSNDGRKFNRGKLLNIGFDMARKNKSKHHDVFIFHDVDLLPQDDLGAWYAKFPQKPIHIARVWNRYSNNEDYIGGVVSFSSSDYKRINGYPNTFWGWGGEDDEMQKRLKKLGVRFDKPDRGTLVDLEEMTLKEKLDFLRQNREWKCMVKWEALDEHDKTWKTNGLSDLKYSVIETTSLDKETNMCTKITVDVKLNGNHWANEKAGTDYMG